MAAAPSAYYDAGSRTKSSGKHFAVNKATPNQLGRTAGKLLRDRLGEAGILDGLYSRIVATMPKVVREFQAEDTGDPEMKVLLPMFQDTASGYAMQFAFARLAVKAATTFTKRPWMEFTEGLVGYASDSMGDPIGGVRFHIHEDINDCENAVARLCSHYPPDAAPVLIDATQRIEGIVSEVFAGLDTGNRRSMVSVLKFLVLLLVGLGVTTLIGLSYPIFLVTAIIVGLFGFRMGKSTKVPVNPRDVPLSPMVTLSYREFDRWARKNDLRTMDPEFFKRTDVHWTEKVPVLLSGSDAAGHRFEPSRSTTKLLFVDLCLGAFVFVPALHEQVDSLNSRGSLAVQFMCGLLLGQVAGRAAGGFYRWLRATM